MTIDKLSQGDDLVNWARAYAAIGLRPIRVARGSKRAVDLEWQRQPMPGAAEIDRLFGDWDGNLGICGDDRIVVLDFDRVLSATGAESKRLAGALHTTLTAATPGGGEHWFYRYAAGQEPLGNRTDVFSLKQTKEDGALDIRGRGGYVVACPSLVDARAYTWIQRAPIVDLSPSLYELLTRKRQVAAWADASVSDDRELNVRRARAVLERCEPSISGQGGHKALLRVCIVLHGFVRRGLDVADAKALLGWYNATKCEPAWSQVELAHKWEDAANAHTPYDPGPARSIEVARSALAANDTDDDDGGRETEPIAVEALFGDAVMVPLRDGEDWTQRFKLTKEGTVSTTAPINAWITMAWHPLALGRIRTNEFGGTIFTSPPQDPVQRMRPAGDDEILMWASFVQQAGAKSATGLDTARNGLRLIGRHRRYDSLKDYITPLRWDGVDRLGPEMLAERLGVRITGLSPLYTRKVFRAWITQGAARALDPGCAAHNVLVLEGAQNLGKSTLARQLCPSPDMFANVNIRNIGRDQTLRDVQQKLSGKWIVELAELQIGDGEATKDFITSDFDFYRTPYDTVPLKHERRCIFLATKNPGGGYLRDATGNRRFWPLLATKIDLDWFVAHRDQIWAQAAHHYREFLETRVPYWVHEPEEFSVFNAQGEERMEVSAEEEIVADYLRAREADRRPVRMADIAFAAKEAGVRVGNIEIRRELQRAGYESVREWIDNKATRHWVKVK